MREYYAACYCANQANEKEENARAAAANHVSKLRPA